MIVVNVNGYGKIMNDIDSSPICENPECNNVVLRKLIRRGKPTKKWKKCCSIECENKLKILNCNKKLKEEYGVSNAMQLDEVKNKIKNTNIERYGVENPTQLEETREKMRNTMMEKYGVMHQMHLDEVKDKIKNTNIEKYGVENPFNSQEIRLKIEKKFEDNYGYKTPLLSDEVREKINDSIITRYGVPHISYINIGKENYNKLIDKNWCEDYLKNHSISEFIDELKISRITAIKHLINHNLLEISKSYFENEIGSFLSTLGLSYIQGTRKIIPPLEIDFVVNNISIECNGTYWHSELMGKNKKYHISKTINANNSGYHMIHIWEHDWRSKKELIQSRLKSIFNLNERIYARKTNIVEINNTITKNFLNENHIQGYCPSSISYGLEYNNELMAIMTFGKSRFNKDIQYELLRYCSKQNYNIIGGASKLFYYFVKNANPSSIISYSDKSWNTGNLYKSLGFNYSHTSAPSYKYTKNGINVYNRINFQKHKLKEILPLFDENKSEWENMVNNGYDRIWDCGNDVYIWKTT
jgi:hypothetical protein